MRQQSRTFWRSAAALLAALGIVANATVVAFTPAAASNVTVTPVELTGVVKNPGKGWIIYDGSGNLTPATTALASVGYNRVNWFQLEPSEGVYNWALIDNQIAAYAAYGMKFAFGVMAENSCESTQYVTPQWVFAAGAASTTGFISDCAGGKVHTTPVWNDPVFLQKFRDMLAAVAARYDGSDSIAFFDIRSYGNWGELGTNSYFPGSQPISENDFKTKHLQMFLDVYTKTPLVATANGIFTNAFNWAVGQGIGIRRDGIPDNDNGSAITPAYGNGYGVVEWTGGWQGYHWNTATLAAADATAKASFGNLGQWGADGAVFVADQPAYTASQANKLGYHFVLTSATVPNAIVNGTSYPTSLTWNNKGLNYSYEPMRLAYALLDASNNVVAKYFPDTGTNLQRLAPGTTIETPNLVFSGVAAGTYKLAVGVFKSTTDANPLYNLAITGRTSNGWYPLLSGVTVSGSGSTSAYPQVYEAEFQSATFSTGKHTVHARDAAANSGMTVRFTGTGTGQWTQFPLTITQTGTMDVKVRINKNAGGGNFQLSVDGVNVGSPIFSYASTSQYQELDLGNITLSSAGVHQFRFTNVGTSVSDYGLTIDSITIGSSGTTPPTNPPGGTIVDDLNDWSKTSSHTANLTFDTQNTASYGGDGSRAARLTSTNEEIVWQNTGTTSVQAIGWFHNSEAVSDFQIYTSANGSTWSLASPTITPGTVGTWTPRTYTLNALTNTNYVKIRWTSTGVNWNPQLGQVTITQTSTPPPGGGSGVFEAEAGTFTGGAQVQSASNASGGSVVGNINAQAASVTVSGVDGSAGGNGTVVIRYANGNADNRSLSLYVNGVKIQQVVFPPSGGWNTWVDSSAITIPLNAGTGNTIKLQRDASDSQSADIDRFTVTSPTGGGGGGGPAKLSGTAFGTTGTWSPPSDTFDKVYDGSTTTYFDSTTATGAYAGIDLGSGVTKVVNSIKFCARAGYESRMVGATFQIGNTSTSAGFTTVYTITTQPTAGCTTVPITGAAGSRYLRYVGGTNSYTNVTEVEFWGQ